MIVVYGCESWSLILNGKVRLRVFQNHVLKEMFGPKGDESTRKCRKLHTYLHLPKIIRVIEPRAMKFASYMADMVREKWVRCSGGEAGHGEDRRS